ncbi:Sensor histidine kinase LiaS [Streptomyces hundungensis]|uniref:histidine kinase n=1 Tax=Streptomyces hundungensis TaxID=1077946 RepID=A0A387HI34_9ACTN|nr:histidine kinase [Streptomyces hundungensis]AYG83526.1 Sensor histidine kinase LiaS [Streptomyces hundungensis]
MSPVRGWLLRHPRAAATGRPLLAAVLVALVTYEGVALARQPTRPHAIVWSAGIAVCVCAVPWAKVALVPRAWTAAAVSWTATVALFVSGRPDAVWGMGEAIALLVLLSSVLLYAPARTTAVLGPLLALGCMAAPVRDAHPGRFTLLFAALAVVVSAYSLLLRAQSSQRMRDLEAVRAAERIELARELHDLVAHHVTGIVVQAQAARFTARSGEHAAASFARIEEAGGEALGAMRRLVRVLREGAAETEPVAGVAQIRELAARFSRAGPPAVLTIEPGLEERLPGDAAALAHRVVRESLTNVRKHAADASAVRIGIRATTDALEVRVADDGSSGVALAEQARGGGFGLAGLTERVTAMGGELAAGPAAEGGWQVVVRVPLDAG